MNWLGGDMPAGRKNVTNLTGDENYVDLHNIN